MTSRGVCVWMFFYRFSSYKKGFPVHTLEALLERRRFVGLFYQGEESYIGVLTS